MFREEYPAGALLSVGFDGTVLPDWLRDAISERKVGGIVIFKRNIESLEQIKELIAEAKSLSPDGKLVVSVDEEGGRVGRHPEPFPHIKTPREFGMEDDVDNTRAEFARLGKALKELGYTIDFAPVVDVSPAAGEDSFIGDRSFGSDPELVSRHATAAIEGLKSAGMPACAKHFPGHGSASGDSHLFLPHVDEDAFTLYSRDIVPFKAAIAANVDAIMTAHLRIPALDPEEPATFSFRILKDLLRGELGFKGIIISDDLTMGAVKDAFLTPGEAAVAALNAGCDMLLYCSKKPPIELIHKAVAEAISDNTISIDDLIAASKRVELVA